MALPSSTWTTRLDLFPYILFHVRVHLRGKEHQEKHRAPLDKQTVGELLSSMDDPLGAAQLHTPETPGCFVLLPDL